MDKGAKGGMCDVSSRIKTGLVKINGEARSNLPRQSPGV